MSALTTTGLTNSCHVVERVPASLYQRQLLRGKPASQMVFRSIVLYTQTSSRARASSLSASTHGSKTRDPVQFVERGSPTVTTASARKTPAAAFQNFRLLSGVSAMSQSRAGTDSEKLEEFPGVAP